MRQRKRWEVVEGQIRKHDYRRGVELGVYRGETFRYLLQKCPWLQLAGVDLFDSQYYHSTRAGRPAKNFNLEAEHAALVEWLRDPRYAARGMLLVTTTVLAADQFPDASQDFVFVDADHRYEAVAADLAAWTPKVRAGGMVIGHDWNEPEFPGVVRAVYERFGHGPIAFGEDHTWWVWR